MSLSLLIRAVWIETIPIDWNASSIDRRCSYEQCGLKLSSFDPKYRTLRRCSYEQCGLKPILSSFDCGSAIKSLLIRAVWIETISSMRSCISRVGRCSYEQCGLKQKFRYCKESARGRCSYEQCGLKLLRVLPKQYVARVAAHTSSVD